MGPTETVTSTANELPEDWEEWARIFRYSDGNLTWIPGVGIAEAALDLRKEYQAWARRNYESVAAYFGVTPEWIDQTLADALLVGTPVGPAASLGRLGRAGKLHHIMTNKNWTSTLGGGPWSPRFADLAKKAGMTLDDVANTVEVVGHGGPHPEVYYAAVFRRLTEATKGLSGDAYSAAFQAELKAIGQEAATPGTPLNLMIAGP